MRKKRAGSPGDAWTLINFVSESWFSNNQILHWFKCYAYLHFNHRRSFFFFLFFCYPSSVGVSIARSAERSMTLALNVRNTHTKTHSTVQWQYSFPLSLSLSHSVTHYHEAALSYGSLYPAHPLINSNLALRRWHEHARWSVKRTCVSARTCTGALAQVQQPDRRS